jgi:hypothetical protein
MWWWEDVSRLKGWAGNGRRTGALGWKQTHPTEMIEAGRPNMTSTHRNWFRPLVAAIGIAAAVTETTTVWAQGFGPDPFRPYNSQYDPYIYPMGAAGPGAGGSTSFNLPGNRSSNQYQNFLNEMQGPSYSNGARFSHNGIGQPYFQSTVDPEYARLYRREYKPRLKTEKSFEETQRLINEKYFAYLEEKDPKKRARLLRDYQQTQTLATRVLSTRLADPAGVLESANRADSGPASVKPDGASSKGSSAAGSSRLPSSLLDRSRGGNSRSIPPAPSLSIGSSPRIKTRSAPTPSDVLNRARSLEIPKNRPTRPATKGANDSSP